MFKLFMAFAVAFLLPGFAWAAESCHHAETIVAGADAIDEGHHAGHKHSTALSGGMEEVPQTAPVSTTEAHNMKEACAFHPGVTHSCSSQRALMKCGMHGCCIKSELPAADSGFSPKVSPEMAIDVHEGLNPFSLKGPVSPYLLETISNYYPPVPRPPSA